MTDEVVPCFNKFQRDFLVSVTVHKARNLNVLNADTAVIIEFNEETKKTKTYQNSDCPFFNEYFVFEIRTTLDDLLKKNIRLSVVQTSCFLKKNATIGEVNVNLSIIWKQNYHAFVKKWAVLEQINKTNTAGYLQIDLSIVTTSETPAPVGLLSYNDEVIEENLLLPDDAGSDPEDVKYLISIFDGKFVVKRDYILQVSFGSLRTRTRQINYSKYCQWNEQIMFKGKFQSLNQMLVFDLFVKDCHQWKVKCSFELNFSDMCWKIDGHYNKPFFGPAHIFFYEGVHKNLYYGKLLLKIDTENIDEKVAVTLQHKQDILMPLNESEYWNDEIFKIHMVLVSLDALNLQQNHEKLYLSCEDNFSNSLDLNIKEYSEKLKVKYVEFASNVRPLMTMSVKLADHRLKFQMKNLVEMLVQEMETNIKSFKLFEARYHNNVGYQSDCINMFFTDLKVMLDGIKSKLYYKTFKKVSEWDENFLKLVQSTIDACSSKIAAHLNERVEEHNKFQTYLVIRDTLAEILNDRHWAQPDVFLNVSCDGKLLAFHRFQMRNYFHSQSFEARGKFCGRIQTILMKPVTCLHSCLKCGCFYGKLEVLMWIGSDKEVNEWLPQNVVELGTNKVNFTVERYYKLNVFVHQAKIQPGFDKSGLCDPKLVIVANGMHEKTKVADQSLSAVWNEVLVIENIKLFDIGEIKHVDYPMLFMFLFDEDKRKMDLIGIGMMNIALNSAHEPTFNKPIIPASLLPEKVDIRKVLHHFINHSPPHLRWINFHANGSSTAEVLMSAELIQQHVPVLTVQKSTRNEPIPPEIKPDMKKFRIEVTFSGVRNALKMSHFASGRYKIELTMGELKLASGFSGKAYNSSVNFLDPYASGYLLLSEQLQFWPPIIIKHLDCSQKHPNVIGAAMIRRPEKFFIEEKPKTMQRFLLNQNPSDDVEAQHLGKLAIEESEPLLGSSNMTDGNNLVKRALRQLSMPKFLQFSDEAGTTDEFTLENEYSWWIKFYNSNRESNYRNCKIHQLTIYKSELEKQPEFEYLNDWAFPIDLIRGKNDSGKSEKYATLKCSIKVSKCAGKEFFESNKEEKFTMGFSRFKQNLIVEQSIVVRVYILQALNLRPRDVSGYSDAFVKVEFGSQIIKDQAHYIPNQFNPVFGKRFQLSGVLPRNTTLKISVFDRDTFSRNDLIGVTTIDIEDRVRSKYLASCGVQKEYNSTGYNAWRNALLPSEILTNICNENELTMPQYFPDHVQLAGIEFKDTSRITKDSNTKERLALSVLNNFQRIPGIGYSLIPEHVETRSLYKDNRPGVEQGKLQMWIEVLDPKKTIPAAIDITPTPARSFELRVIIWNAKDVTLDEKNIFGSSMSDIYVKGWLHNHDESQFTDVHYRSLNGEGNFNWRMIFPFKYSLGEDMMVMMKKHPFEKLETELKVPAILNLQVWDNDSFSPDDFLGTLQINLSHFPSPFDAAHKCTLKRTDRVHNNIFATTRSVRGWFPVYGKSGETNEISGKLDLELEVCLEERAKLNPVGIGREGPNKLPPPNRPDTSFNWLKHPMRSLKHILWPKTRKTCAIAVLVLTLLVILWIIVVNLPQAFISKAVGS